jgi:hypothetical protein
MMRGAGFGRIAGLAAEQAARLESRLVEAIDDAGQGQLLRLDREGESALRTARAGHDAGLGERVESLRQVVPGRGGRLGDLVGAQKAEPVCASEDQNGAECVVGSGRQHGMTSGKDQFLISI